MRGSPLVMCCWPGLPKLWLRGDPRSLAIALAFGVGLNLLLVFTTLPNDWVPMPLGTAAWIAIGSLWLWSSIRSYREWPNLCKPVSAADHRGLFLQAQGEYLKGHWFEAESVLGELLRKCPGDVDAGLLRATLYRRTKRYSEALAELGRIEQFESAVKWQAEIAVERRLVGEREERDRQEKASGEKASGEKAIPGQQVTGAGIERA